MLVRDETGSRDEDISPPFMSRPNVYSIKYKESCWPEIRPEVEMTHLTSRKGKNTNRVALATTLTASYAHLR